jgi:glycosyltransferase involved in cell wall biosynthesis
MIRIVYADDGVSLYDGFFLNYLSKKFDVTLLTFHPKANKLCFENVHIIKIDELPRQFPICDGVRVYSLAFIRAFLLRRFLETLAPDVLIGNWASTYGFYSALSGFKRFILFVWGSDVLLEPRIFFLRPMIEYSIRKASFIVVDSDVQRQAVIGLGGHSKKIVKFPWFDFDVVHTWMSRQSKGRKDIREKLGWNNNPIVISLRGHHPIYGLKYLIKAIPQVIDKAPETRFLILGEGALTGSLMNLAEKLNVASYAKFVGGVPRLEVIKYLVASDIYVSTSLSDGTSASLLESMTCGLPAILTDIPGNREWIKNGENGLLVPTKDSQSLAERIVLLANDRNLCRTLGRNSLITVSQKSNWSENSRVLDDIIEKLAEKKMCVEDNYLGYCSKEKRRS